jgi:hypothetical protein
MPSYCPSWPGLARPSTLPSTPLAMAALTLFGVVITEDVVHSMIPTQRGLNGYSRAEPTIYTSPHLQDEPLDYPSVRGTATYYVSGVPASGYPWMPGTSPGMTV